MTLLLDTRVLLWWLANDPKLSGDYRDPFDRMLIAQARVEKLVLLTADERIRKCDVNVR